MPEQAGPGTLYIFGSLEIMCKNCNFYKTASVYESSGSREADVGAAGPFLKPLTETSRNVRARCFVVF